MESMNEACDRCEKDCGLLIHGMRVVSFFKVMIDERCLDVLFFPPKFARSVSQLTDQETYLEDSRGQRWRVTVCIHNGSLAIQQGWPEFLSEHDVDVGNFLVFHYVPASKNFVVQIFGTSGCEKDCRLLIHGKRVVSFFKVMIDERCLEVLFFPPKFARSVSQLTDQETYLEDSRGQRWRVTVCIHNGSLAIQQGWPEFLSEHDVDVGNFLVFHYVPASKNFVVQIFGTSGCEKDCRLLIHGKRVVSFFKVMIDERCLEVLFFPPKFARSVSQLTDQETYLEDSRGQQWRVTVCIHNGSLAIQQGWPEFLSEHDVDVGNFLVFHYVPASKNFGVQIFGTSGCEKDSGLLIHGKRVASFFKVMIDERCFEVMFFSPKFARSVSHLTDQETYLEDSSGRRWRVTVCIHNGSLAIRQGWPEFLSEHGVDMVNFLVFHYVPASKHFIVQIFGTSGCEKIKFCSDIGKGKKPEESTHVAYKSNIADSGKGQLVPSPIYADELLCMINRDVQYDQDDGRLCLHLSSFEMTEVKPFAEGTNSPFKGDNANETNLGSLTEPLLSKFEAGITATDNMVSKPVENFPLLVPKDEKSKESS